MSLIIVDKVWLVTENERCPTLFHMLRQVIWSVSTYR